MTKPSSKTAPQFVLRYTSELRDKIARLAKANGRSINSELIALLERALSHGDDVEQLQQSTGELFDRMEKLESIARRRDIARYLRRRARKANEQKNKPQPDPAGAFA